MLQQVRADPKCQTRNLKTIKPPTPYPKSENPKLKRPDLSAVSRFFPGRRLLAKGANWFRNGLCWSSASDESPPEGRAVGLGFRGVDLGLGFRGLDLGLGAEGLGV